MFGISVHSLISEIKYFTKTYICKSQSQSSTFHQKKYICKSQHQNSTYAGMAGVAEALFANAPIWARGVLKQEQVNRIRCQRVSEKVCQEASELFIKVSYKHKRYCQLTQNPSTFEPGTLSLFHRPSYPSTRRCLDTVLQPPRSRRDRHTLERDWHFTKSAAPPVSKNLVTHSSEHPHIYILWKSPLDKYSSSHLYEPMVFTQEDPG